VEFMTGFFRGNVVCQSSDVSGAWWVQFEDGDGGDVPLSELIFLSRAGWCSEEPPRAYPDLAPHASPRASAARAAAKKVLGKVRLGAAGQAGNGALLLTQRAGPRRLSRRELTALDVWDVKVTSPAAARGPRPPAAETRGGCGAAPRERANLQ
jgi:hypothetical protein